MYKARLRVNGNLVAIKVQRPNCESTISLDLYVLRFYAGFLTKALKALKREVDLTSIIDDFGELIYREIDYRAEMVNCQRFAELYANIPDVFVPKVGGLTETTDANVSHVYMYVRHEVAGTPQI